MGMIKMKRPLIFVSDDGEFRGEYHYKMVCDKCHKKIGYSKDGKHSPHYWFTCVKHMDWRDIEL